MHVSETTVNIKRIESYKVIGVACEGGKYVLKNIFDDTKLECIADKIKPYLGNEEWELEPEQIEMTEDAPLINHLKIPTEL